MTLEELMEQIPPLGFKGERWWPVGDYLISRNLNRISRAVVHYSAPLRGRMAYVWGGKIELYVSVGRDYGPCDEVEHRTRFVEASRRSTTIPTDPFMLKMTIIGLVEKAKNSGWGR